MTDRIWINGELVEADRASVSVLDHGVTVGDGVFETLKVVRDGDAILHPFAITRHLRRLRRSAAGMGLPVPVDDDGLRAAVRAVLDANAATAGRVRITITGGRGPLGSGREPEHDVTDSGAPRPSVVIASSPLAPWPATTTVATVPWRRNEHSPLAGVKSTSYGENVVALEYARGKGAGEAILANTAGDLCEGTSTNIFVGIGGRLVTPPLSSGCLAGVTRELVIELVAVAEERLPLEALHDADEVFLTSSTRDVQPVSAVDDRPLPSCPGPLTRAAAEAFAALVARDLDP